MIMTFLSVEMLGSGGNFFRCILWIVLKYISIHILDQSIRHSSLPEKDLRELGRVARYYVEPVCYHAAENIEMNGETKWNITGPKYLQTFLLYSI